MPFQNDADVIVELYYLFFYHYARHGIFGTFCANWNVVSDSCGAGGKSSHT